MGFPFISSFNYWWWCQADFERVRSFGLNAVRLPFGYWVITEPRPGGIRFVKKKYIIFQLDIISGIFFLQFCFSIRSIFSALKNWDLRNWIIKIQNNHEDWIQKPLSDELNSQHIFRVKPFEGVRWSDETTNGNLRRPKEPYVGPALEYVDRAVAWAEDKQKCTATCCAEKNGWGAVRV